MPIEGTTSEVGLDEPNMPPLTVSGFQSLAESRGGALDRDREAE